MEPVGLGVQPQKPFETIGNVVNMANTLQNMQRGGIALQTEGMVLRERNAVSQYLANPRNYMNEKGEIDSAKLQNDVLSIAPTTGSQYIQHVTEAQRAGTEARRALNTATEEERKIAGTLAMSLTGKPAAEAAAALTGYAEQNKNLKPAVDAILKYYVAPNAGNQDALNKAYLAVGRGIMTPPEQAAAISGQYQNTGGELTQTGQVAQAAGLAPKTIDLTLPLAEREKVSQHPYTQGFVTEIKDAQGQVRGVVPTPMDVRLPQPVSGGKAASDYTALTMGEDLKRNLQESENAGRSISALQEIRKYAPGAATGALQEKRQFAQKLFGWLGLQYSDDVATKTDLLAKNSNMLAAAGGNTDLARVLAEAANPNTQMTPQAILRAVDQVLGQQQLKLARGHYLQQYANNPEAYGRAVTEFNRMADPRVFEYPNWSMEEKQAQKSNMNPTERKAFGDALRFFQEKGYIR